MTKPATISYSIQFNFIFRAPYTIKLSTGALQRMETHSLNPHISTDLEQDQAHKEEPSR